MGDPIGTYQGKPRRDDWPCGPKRPEPRADRKPLAGWDHSGEDSTFWFPGGDMVASTGRMWVAIRQRSKSDYGHGMGIAAACIAAEDAARAMVADMAAALGGRVVWNESEVE